MKQKKEVTKARKFLYVKYGATGIILKVGKYKKGALRRRLNA